MTMSLPAAGRPAARAPRPVACFTVTAQADPGLLPRLVGLFAKLGRTPLRCHADLIEGPHGADLVVDLQVADLDGKAALALARRLEALWGVTAVLLSRRRSG